MDLFLASIVQQLMLIKKIPVQILFEIMYASKNIYYKKKEEKQNNTASSQTNSSTTLSSSSAVNSATSPLTKYGLVMKTTKLTSHEKTKVKELIVNWLCQSMRPFSLVNDNGFRNVIQQVISLGKNRS